MNRTPALSPDDAERQRHAKSMWEAGDLGLIAKFSEPTAAEFMSRLSLKPGTRVLDLACGSGNLALLAARAGSITSGLDLASNLIVLAQARAQARQLAIDFMEGDAEALPYEEAQFEVILSMFGVMFTPRPKRVTAEILRVCRPGGTIALAHWTPEGFISECFDLVQRYLPALSGMVSPLLWGDETTVRSRLGDNVRDLRLARCSARLRYPFTPGQTVDFFRRYFGPTLRVFEALEPHSQQQLHAELENLVHAHNRARDGSTEVEAEYLEIVATRC